MGRNMPSSWELTFIFPPFQYPSISSLFYSPTYFRNVFTITLCKSHLAGIKLLNILGNVRVGIYEEKKN